MKYNNKVSAATIARTAALLLALANQILSAFGKSPLPIESSTVEQLVTTGITTVTALINWWYNNSFTQAAIEGDKTYENVKNQIHKGRPSSYHITARASRYSSHKRAGRLFFYCCFLQYLPRKRT